MDRVGERIIRFITEFRLLIVGKANGDKLDFVLMMLCRKYEYSFSKFNVYFLTFRANEL